MTASFDFHFLKIHSLLSGGYSKFHFVTFRQGNDELFLTFQKPVSNIAGRKRVSNFWPSATCLQPSPAVLPIPISFSCSRPITRPACATRPCMATAVCLHGSAHDVLTGDSRECQRYIQIVVPIPFPIPIPIPIQSSFSRVVLCLTEYHRFFLFLCLHHKCFPFPFPSLYLQ